MNFFKTTLLNNFHLLPKLLVILFVLLMLGSQAQSTFAHEPPPTGPMNLLCPPDHSLETDASDASVCVDNAPSGGAAGPSGPLFIIPNFSGFTNLGDIIDNLIQLTFFVTGLAFFFYLILGGIQWITASGDPKALDAARGRITNAIIGLIIVVAAFSLAIIIQSVLGISIVSGFCFTNCG